MGLLFLVPGLILLLTNGWFSDQHTVGWILTIVGGAILVLQFAFMAIAGAIVAREHKKIRF